MLLGPLRLALKLFTTLVAALLVYFVVTLVQVWLTSRHYAPQAAGAIVVMGAAQYDGVPSPDLRSRLDEALSLYRQGYAHTVVVTGGKEQGDQFTEAQAGSRYLQLAGVPPAAILEAGGSDSYQNLSGAAAELVPRGLTRVLVTTDPFHEDRSLAIASGLGLQPSPTPTRTSPIQGWSAVPYYLREAAAVSLGRVVGYGHMSSLVQ